MVAVVARLVARPSPTQYWKESHDIVRLGDVGEGAIRIQRQGAVSRAEADDGRRTDGVAVGVRIVVQHTLCRGHDQSGVVLTEKSSLQCRGLS